MYDSEQKAGDANADFMGLDTSWLEA